MMENRLKVKTARDKIDYSKGVFHYDNPKGELSSVLRSMGELSKLIKCRSVKD
jgi:hypothetical protein